MTDLPATSQVRSSVPTWYWAVCVIAVLWNLMGVAAFLTQVVGGAAAIEAMPEAQQDWARSIPGWINVVFGVAVFSGLLGCLGLLMRSAWAFPVFVLSFIAVVTQMIYTMVFAKGMDVLGPADKGLSLAVTMIALFLAWFARIGVGKEWLR